VTLKTHICSVTILNLLTGKSSMCRPDLAPSLGQNLIDKMFAADKFFSAKVGELKVHYHPEAYLNEGQHTMCVVNACGPCDDRNKDSIVFW
jgi:hypothetical protein